MKTLHAVTTCFAFAVLSPSSALAQNEPWWNGAPDAPGDRSAAPALPPPPAPPAAQAQPQPPPPPQAEPAQEQPAPPAAQSEPPSPVPASEAAAYPPAPQVTEQMAAQGEWVYTPQYGWTWVPYGSTALTVGAQPYVYLFAPSYGWRWFVSPWGIGPFHYGAWGWGPRWGPRYAPPRGLAGFHYAPGAGARGVYTPRAYGGSVHGAPIHAGGAGRAYGGAHFGGGGHHR
jgi:hypothetical protein